MTPDFKGLLHSIKDLLDTIDYSGYDSQADQKNLRETLTKLDAFLEADFGIEDFVRDTHIEQVSKSKEKFVKMRMEDLLTMLKGLRVLQTITEKEE